MKANKNYQLFSQLHTGVDNSNTSVFSKLKLDLPSIRGEVLSIIESLPQRKFIKNEDLDKWIDHVLTYMPEKAIFLAKRLGTIGGSEIGVLVQSQRNREAEFISDYGFSHSTDFDIINHKLLKVLPDANNDNFKRGNLFESCAQSSYIEFLLQKYEKVIIRHDIKDKILNSAGSFPWARVQVDDVIQCDDKLILTDYKVPSSQGFNSMLYSEPLTYSCQTTLGKMIANSIGITIDLMTVVPLDINKGKVNELIVDNDCNLEREIILTGEYYHELIVNGKYPPSQIPKHAVFSKEILPDQLVSDIYNEGILRQLAISIKQIQERHSSRIDNALKKIYAASNCNDSYKINIGTMCLSGSQNKNIDKQAAITFLVSNGVSEEIATKTAKRVDRLEKELTKYLSHPEDIKQFQTETFDLSLSSSRATKGKIKDLKDLLTSELTQRLDEMVEDLSEKLCEHDSIELNPDFIQKSQQRQLESLARIAEQSTNDKIANRANRILSIRSDSYEQGNPYITNVEPTLTKDSRVTNDLTEEQPELSHLIKFFI